MRRQLLISRGGFAGAIALVALAALPLAAQGQSRAEKGGGEGVDGAQDAVGRSGHLGSVDQR